MATVSWASYKKTLREENEKQKKKEKKKRKKDRWITGRDVGSLPQGERL
jgi:hypothetical protein